MSTPQTVLKIEDLIAGYGAVSVLKGLSFEVRPGEALTVIGANGAGKTTLMRAITGLIALRGGGKFFYGADISRTHAHELPPQGLVLVPEGRRIFPRLTVAENLHLGAFCSRNHSRSAHMLQHMFELFPILADRRTQLGGTLSGGEQQMLAIARALMSEPKLLLLDEPSLGVAPLFIERIFKALSMLRSEGLSMLLIEQNAQIALQFADRALVLDNGAITLSGDAKALRDDERVREAYMKA